MTHRCPFLPRVLALAALGMAAVRFAAPAHAFPPYAEQWSVPSPIEVEVDPLGRVWVASNDDSIRVYSATGGTLLFAFGGSGSGDGQFQTPYGMAFDAAGDVYICDYLGVRVEKFDADGNFLFAWPTPGNRADHIAFDAAGDVYVSGFSNQMIHKYTPGGMPILDWPSNGLAYPSGIVESGGVIHVVQWLAPTVEQFLPDGTYLGSFDTGADNATDIEVDVTGRLFVADYENGMIRVFGPAGAPVDATGAVGTGPGEFQGLSGIAIGPDGSIYATDEQNHRVQRFGTTSVGVPHVTAPEVAALRTIAPNPCRTSTTVSFALAQEERVRLSVLDVTGRRVATLAEGVMPAGAHRIGWAPRDQDGRGLVPGVYLVSLEHGAQVESRRLAVMR